MSKAGRYGQSSKSGEGRMIGQLELAKMCRCYWAVQQMKIVVLDVKYYSQ